MAGGPVRGHLGVPHVYWRKRRRHGCLRSPGGASWRLGCSCTGQYSPLSCPMADWFMEECMMLSDWTLGGRGGIWLPAAQEVQEHGFRAWLQEDVSVLTPCPLTWDSSRGQWAGARGGDAGWRTHGRGRGPADAWQVGGRVWREGRLGRVALLALTAGHSGSADAGAQCPLGPGGQVIDGARQVLQPDQNHW